jgi:hypothetical protein
MQATHASKLGGSEEDGAHMAHAKSAEFTIKAMVEEIVRSNDDQETITGLDILHKLVSK